MLQFIRICGKLSSKPSKSSLTGIIARPNCLRRETRESSWFQATGTAFA